MVIANLITYCLVLLGGLVWGIYGATGWNLVGAIMGGELAVGSIIIYILVGLSAIWLIISPFITSGWLKLSERKEER